MRTNRGNLLWDRASKDVILGHLDTEITSASTGNNLPGFKVENLSFKGIYMIGQERGSQTDTSAPLRRLLGMLEQPTWLTLVFTTAVETLELDTPVAPVAPDPDQQADFEIWKLGMKEHRTKVKDSGPASTIWSLANALRHCLSGLSHMRHSLLPIRTGLPWLS